jgi:hypothetical protein
MMTPNSHLKRCLPQAVPRHRAENSGTYATNYPSGHPCRHANQRRVTLDGTGTDQAGKTVTMGEDKKHRADTEDLPRGVEFPLRCIWPLRDRSLPHTASIPIRRPTE